MKWCLGTAQCTSELLSIVIEVLASGFLLLQSSRGRATKVTARVSARTDSGMKVRGAGGTGGTLHPPMSSVVVERHPPVTKVHSGQAHSTFYSIPNSFLLT